MVKNEDFNIFDESRKQMDKKKKKKVVKPSSSKESLTLNNQKESSPSNPKSPADDMEIDNMLKRLRYMDHDLREKIGRICELSGMTKREIERYIENPDNFSDYEWNKVQHEKEKLEDKLFTTIGIKTKKRILKKKKSKISKERRGKTLGGRKGWIQM